MKTRYMFLLLICLTLSLNTQAESQPKTTVEVLSKTTKSWNGSKLPAYPSGQPEVTILKVIIPAGEKIPLHEHRVINAGVLIRGELTVITEAGDKLIIKAGEPITEVVNQWHYGVNSGNQTAEIIVFYAGIENQPITVKNK